MNRRHTITSEGRVVGRAQQGFSLIELLIVVTLTTILAAMAVPMTSNSLGFFRLSGDARGVLSAMSLTKLRAASDFTKARVYLDLGARAFRVETWQKTAAAWAVVGGTTNLSTNDTFGFGVVPTAPPNTQNVIGQAPLCLDNEGNAIANTACVLFNSRGIPVDAAGAPTASNAVYVTDGTAVYAATLSATGLIRLWLTRAGNPPVWMLQ